jgi:hypothetical protein
MLRKIIIAVSFLLATAGTVAGAAEQTGDIALEVKGNWLTLPAETSGTLVVKTCGSCSTREYEINEQTSFEIGGIQVRIDEMRRELISRPRELLLLQLTPDRKHVDRIVISAQSN